MYKRQAIKSGFELLGTWIDLGNKGVGHIARAMDGTVSNERDHDRPERVESEACHAEKKIIEIDWLDGRIEHGDAITDDAHE